MNTKKLSYIFAGLTILFWGTAASAFKFTLNHFSFVQLLAWSSLFSTLLLLAIMLFSGKYRLMTKTSRLEIIPSLYLGLLNPFGYYFILLRAYELLPAQVAQPLNFIWPLILVLLSVPLLGEKITAKGVFALLISFGGVILISSEGNISSIEIKSPLGVMLALSSSFIWALYWILNLRNSKLDPVVRLFFNFLFATIYSFAAGLFFSDFWSINLMGIFGSLYVGSFEMGITFVLWLKALSMAESKAKLSNIIYLVPFVSLVFIHFFVGEQIYWTTIVGLLVIVGSILFQQLSRSKRT
ncbi:DMT family transporter [Perlabentimonas gracilis]|jgi:drug/metabolite transporter (DMT)-like permease|uniref:DMT family transporter n=1 Tax=Perlabentimonas gracilis TaxID=2715279 RepID=UPI00140CECC8|nr:DMT family transporter [Perlabentimonas gracilis]NHB67865.1 DMT family transporter [Perlabentimonas gracilis]